MRDRASKAREIIQRAECWAFGIGFIPIPLLDAAAVTMLHMDLLHKLARLYDVPYVEVEAKPIVVSLLGSLLPTYFGTHAAITIARLIPGVGPLLGIATLPTSLGAATRIIGKIVAEHLERGGTLKDLDLRVINASPTSGAPSRREPEQTAEAPVEAAGDTTPQPEAGEGDSDGDEKRDIARASADEGDAGAPDDLTTIIGIGPKIAALLASAGIRTFKTLASTTVAELDAVLETGGMRFKTHDPQTWPEQARVLLAGGVEELRRYWRSRARASADSSGAQVESDHAR